MGVTFNELGTKDIFEIATQYNTGDISADRAMESLLILITDTFGGEVVERKVEPAEALAQALDAYLRPNELMYNAKFWSPEQWVNEKGEGMCPTAALHLTYEGPLYDAINYGTGREYSKIRDIANAYGYCFELGYSWSMHFYPNS